MFRVGAFSAAKQILAITALWALAGCADTQPTEPVSPAASGYLLDDGPSPSATLVECPTTETRTASIEIDPALPPVTGNWLLSLGGTSVSIPLGAVTGPTKIDLTIPASRYVEIRVTANGGHYTFLQPVVVTIDYARCNRSDVLSKPLTAYYIDAATKELQQKMPAVDDKLTRRVSFPTDHFSGYAIAF